VDADADVGQAWEDEDVDEGSAEVMMLDDDVDAFGDVEYDQ